MSEPNGATYAVDYVATAPPRHLAHDELLVVAVTVTNTGTAAWPDADGVPINLGYHWVDGAGQMVAFDGQRTPLGQRVLPGASVTVGLRVLPPESAGEYRLQVDMVKESVAWLSWQGVAMLEFPITVVAAAPRPRVCLINASCTLGDAIGNNLREKVRFFRARGYAVDVLVEAFDQRLPLDEQAFFTVIRYDDLLSGGATPEQQRAVRHFYRADLLIFDYPTYYPLIEAIRLASTGTVFFDYHGVTPPALWGDPSTVEVMRAGERQVQLVGYADYAIAHSHFTANELAATGMIAPSRISMLSYVVPMQEFRPHARNAALVARYGLAGQRVLLYVGRMARNKRINDLVRALALVREHVPNTTLVLVGDTKGRFYAPVVAEAQALAQQLGCASQLVFAGKVAQHELAAHYQSADVFVTASLHEGFCIPVIEAMACGLPVVATHATALPETVGPGGLTFAPQSPTALAAHIVRLFAAAPEHDSAPPSLVAHSMDHINLDHTNV